MCCAEAVEEQLEASNLASALGLVPLGLVPFGLTSTGSKRRKPKKSSNLMQPVSVCVEGLADRCHPFFTIART